MDLCLAIFIYFSCQRSPNENQVITEPVGTWGVDRRGSRSGSKAPVSRGRLASTRRQRLTSRTLRFGVPAGEERPLCPGLCRLRVSVFILSPWLGPAGTAPSVSEARVPAPQTQLSSHICLAVLPNSWDRGRSPLP